MKNIFFRKIMFLLPLSIIACSGNNGKINPHGNSTYSYKKAATLQNAEKGTIIHSIACKADPTWSYSLYLPRNYTPSNQYPVFIFFDPHGNGSLPLKKYQSLSEKYDCILIGSNSSKNGTAWPVSMKIANSLTDETKHSYSVDSNSISMVGFSGGGRVISGTAATRNDILNIISCGAGLSGNINIHNNNTCFIGIAGIEDMNYLEMKLSQSDLKTKTVQNHFIYFNGKHEWPPSYVMEKAILISLLRNNRLNSDKSSYYINNLIALNDSCLREHKKNNEIILLKNSLESIIVSLSNYKQKAKYEHQLKQLTMNYDLKSLEEREQNFFNAELTLQQELLNAIYQKDSVWWNYKIATLLSETDKNQQLIHQRALNYISLASYMIASNMINQGRFEEATMILNIYRMVDPENNEAWYLSAKAYSYLRQNIKAVNYLEISAKKGFYEKERLLEDNKMTELSGDPRFVEIIKQIEKNAAVKQED